MPPAPTRTVQAAGEAARKESGQLPSLVSPSAGPDLSLPGPEAHKTSLEMFPEKRSQPPPPIPFRAPLSAGQVCGSVKRHSTRREGVELGCHDVALQGALALEIM